MKAPIEMMLDGLTWIAVPPNVGGVPDGDNLPYVTHEGVWDFMGQRLRCFRLSDGKAVIHADDMEALFASLDGDSSRNE